MLEELVSRTHGENTWDALLDAAELDGKSRGCPSAAISPKPYTTEKLLIALREAQQ